MYVLLITRSRRHFPPNNFLVKIESYSLLSETGLEYKSDVFEAGGRLSLYPKGIEKTNENGHISLYLGIAETEELPLGWEVNAGFRLFVFDQIRDEYLTVQDGRGGGAIKRFNDLNSEWGFAKFLPLDTFNDVTQGYLVNNCCVFGVEVFVHERTVKRQCLSMIEKPTNSTLTWKIVRFSTLNEERYYSQKFTVEDSKWKLLVYPKGNSTGKNTAISFFLSSCNCIRSEQGVFAEYTLRIRDQLRGKHKEKSAKHWFSTKEEDWGFAEFMPLQDIKDAKGFLVFDTLLVEAEIIVMSKQIDVAENRGPARLAAVNGGPTRFVVGDRGAEEGDDILEILFQIKRLSLYPKGIKKNVMNGHISLYLAITETEELPLGWEVNASFKLFVFDQVRDEYLTVQDAGGGAIRRFNDINSKWGFAKFLPLDTFNDASQGYLVNNCCVFGAEVFVHERSVKRQCLSFIKEPDNSTLTWKIERFSTLNEEYYFSQEFTVGDSTW
ncbi:hypothetical protein CMV_030577 [Castanea mollissima]|uniref:MATH domain-containing protein n=1 Tax=Castanea mollissima TaxID=60419 RepID=A0A8J4Q517_9ROSI|nr:hypothetical protein CMV_030577 [Castanea mollissima]